MTSNIRSYFAPVDTFTRGESAAGGGEAVFQGWGGEVANIVGERRQPLGWEAVDGLFDFATEFESAHGGILNPFVCAASAVRGLASLDHGLPR
jgi:hypothetical protein